MQIAEIRQTTIRQSIIWPMWLSAIYRLQDVTFDEVVLGNAFLSPICIPMKEAIIHNISKKRTTKRITEKKARRNEDR
jgi:hypothetical protein